MAVERSRQAMELDRTDFAGDRPLEGGLNFSGGLQMGGQEAAALRASKRRQNLDASMGVDTEFDTDIRLAEAEDPVERFNEAGVPIEPFHLKQERDDGYFDGEGNYVPFKVDDVNDAWLDSLEDGALKENGGQEQQGNQEPVESDLEDIDVVEQKKCIAELLEQGETVLDGLRRLACRRDSDLAEKELGKVAKLLEKQRQVPVENQESFDKLTECSSLLMAYGECNIYNQTKEEIIRSSESKDSAPFDDDDSNDDEMDAKDSGAAQAAHGKPNADDERPTGEAQQLSSHPIDFGEEGVEPKRHAANPSNTESTASDARVYKAQCPGKKDEGYVLDPDSGRFYNSDTGYYYDPKTDLYGDAATGIWYKSNNGSFEPV